MAKIHGEAIFDNMIKKWIYIIYHDNGDIFLKSESTFNNQEEAENELINILKNFANDLALGKIK